MATSVRSDNRLWVRKVDGDMHVEPPDKQPATRWYPGSSSAKPGSLDELLWCVKNVAAKGPEAEMRATGSHWAMSEASVTPGDMIETATSHAVSYGQLISGCLQLGSGNFCKGRPVFANGRPISKR